MLYVIGVRDLKNTTLHYEQYGHYIIAKNVCNIRYRRVKSQALQWKGKDALKYRKLG